MKDIQNMLLDFKLLKNDEDHMVLYDENYFTITPFFYDLMKALQQGSHKKESFIEHHSIKSKDYNELISLVSEKIQEIKTKPKKKKSYILFSVTIFPEKWVNQLSKNIAFLFKKRYFNFLFPISIIFSGLAFFYVNIHQKNHSLLDVSLIEYIGVYACFFIIMLFHELGHSAASKHFGVDPKEIGLGFYVFFPVLFSNVTRVWQLDKKQRIVVNLGGIFFQGIINIGLFVLLVTLQVFNDASELVEFIKTLIKANIFVMLYALFPFFRNDGFWVVSDYLNIKNLNQKSYRYLFELILNKQPFNIFLLLYSLGQYAFIGYLTYAFLPTIPRNFKALSIFVKDQGILNLFVENISLLFQSVCSLLIAVVVLASISQFITSNYLVLKAKK